LEKGRTKAEKSFIYLKKGRYAGYGFVENSDDFSSAEQFEDYLIPQTNSSYADRIVNRYLNTKKNITRLNLNTAEEVEERQPEEWFG
jgi:DNA polymerase-3 subunit epsilon